MKSDLVTSIVAAVVGAIAAFFICNLIIPKIDDFTYKVLSSTIDYNVQEPNIEVFNYRAIDPAVEVYVGNCTGDDCESSVIINNDNIEEKEEEKAETETEAEKEESENRPTKNPDTNEEPENGATD